MSVSEGLGQTAVARKPSGVLIFLPLLIAVLGAGAIFLGQLSDRNASLVAGHVGYGIDERTTGAITPATDADAPIIALDR